MNGTCPRCGANPHDPRTNSGRLLSAHNRRSDETAFGTLYDSDFDEWSCIDCGCQFAPDGTKRNMAAEWGFDVERGMSRDGRNKPKPGA